MYSKYNNNPHYCGFALFGMYVSIFLCFLSLFCFYMCLQLSKRREIRKGQLSARTPVCQGPSASRCCWFALTSAARSSSAGMHDILDSAHDRVEPTYLMVSYFPPPSLSPARSMARAPGSGA